MVQSKIGKKIWILVVIFFSFSVLIGYVYVSNIQLNYIENKNISLGTGWKNNTSQYAGSELSFKFSNSKDVEFELSTKSKADQGIEIFIDNIAYLLPSSIKQDKKLAIKVNKNSTHSVTVRHFCTYLYDPCEVTLKGIFLDGYAKLYPYQHHDKILSVLGDSISTIYGSNNYSQIVAEQLGYELHNASILGSTVSRVDGADSASKRYKKDLMSFKSNAIIIFLGTNDVEANVPLGDFEKNYAKILSDVKSYNLSSKIFLVGILPRKDLDTSKIMQYNNIIKSVAGSKNTYYIDMSTVLKEKDFSDSIHPSLEGQRKITEYFVNVLSSIL